LSKSGDEAVDHEGPL